MIIKTVGEALELEDKCLRVLGKSNKLQLTTAVNYVRLAQKCLQRNGFAAIALRLDDLVHFVTVIWPPTS